MKKLFLIFPVLFIASCGATANHDATKESSAVLAYREQIIACDNEAAERNQNPEYFSTLGISQAFHKHTECYQTIIFEIIDKYYSKNTEVMKTNISDSIRLSARITGHILRPDSCYPNCGTIISNNSAAASLATAKNYLDFLLNTIY